MAKRFREHVIFGCNPAMIYPDALNEEEALIRCYYLADQLPEYEVMECFLPDNAAERKRIIRNFRRRGLTLNYNLPGYFQLPGPFSTVDDDPEVRKGAYARMKEHVEYAAEAESPLLVLTAPADQGIEVRPELIKRFKEVYLKLCADAGKYGMKVLMEAAERERFKKLLLGPTKECVSFIRSVRADGGTNAGMVLDMAHMPLLEETMEQVIEDSDDVLFEHVHLGNSVLKEGEVYYGHMHAPIGIRGGCFTYEDLVHQFRLMMDCGYIPDKPGIKRAGISLEVRPYPGVTELTSLRAMYEMSESAFYEAAAQKEADT